jgi:hypothetical protein
MKINNVSRKFKTWIKSLWTPRVDIDFLVLVHLHDLDWWYVSSLFAS